jgi:hypothetical protein
MTSMLETIVPKSDQLNSDDLIGGQTKTIKITKVSLAMGEQPVSIHYEGDNGKPYKPGKSMRRVLVGVWGSDANKYVGRSLRLYRDDKVIFGGVAVGGLRVSHMSDIDAPVTMALTASQKSRKPFTVQPLVPGKTELSVDAYLSDIETAPTLDGLEHKYKEAYKLFINPAQRTALLTAKDARKHELTTGESA